MMQNIFTNIKCSEIILYNANENWYIILYDLFSRLCYIATCRPFCKDATHMVSITAKSTYFKELLFALFKIFYTLIIHYVINFVFSIGKQRYREAINFVSYMHVVYDINYTYLYAHKLSLSFS